MVYGALSVGYHLPIALRYTHTQPKLSLLVTQSTRQPAPFRFHHVVHRSALTVSPAKIGDAIKLTDGQRNEAERHNPASSFEHKPPCHHDYVTARLYFGDSTDYRCRRLVALIPSYAQVTTRATRMHCKL